jgi:hypothetical protein
MQEFTVTEITALSPHRQVSLVRWSLLGVPDRARTLDADAPAPRPKPAAIRRRA